MPQLTRPKSAREIAAAIADELFVNGQGEQADRLVLWIDADKQNLGGWAKQAVIDRIEKHLQRDRVS